MATGVTPLPPAGYELVFEDEFNGDKIDTEKWGFRTETKLLSKQQVENISVKGGNLEIALRKEKVGDAEYTGGGVYGKQVFAYGYYEARFKTPPAEGWHTAFWAMDGTFPGQPPRRALLELDFCEQDGGDPHFYSFGIINQSLYFKRKNRQSWNAGRWVIEDAPDTSAGFHVWSCEFTPEVIRFYFDGKLTKELSSAGFPHDDMRVAFSSIASTLKGDLFVDESKLPNTVYCDYIRVYQHPKFSEADEALRAAILLLPPEPKREKPKKPATPESKEELENLN